MHTTRLWTFEGDLYREDKGYKLPIRKRYEWHYSHIRNTHELRATLRTGEYTELGSYPLFFITSDGAALHFKCARENYKQISWSIRNKDNTGGWKIEACEVNWEDSNLYCDHCNKLIESAYGEETEKE